MDLILDDPDYPLIDQLFDMWAEAGGMAAHPTVKTELYRAAAKHGVHLPGMRRIEEN